MFFVTGITGYELIDDEDFEVIEEKGATCFGYFRALRNAQKAVYTNSINVDGNKYKYIVIERISPNIPHPYRDEWDTNWWKYNKEKGLYERTTNKISYSPYFSLK